jgi:hypothetical protein
MATQLKLLRNTALLENEPDSLNTDAGKIRVPTKPSLDMLTAGSSAGGVSVQKAWEIYMAMLRSTPSELR